ncbi:MAG: hypothetical protein ACRDPO_15810 [Streptosporangiaceae bacterium]
MQRPHPPLCVGGSGRRRTLRTAARFAQHRNFGDGTIEDFGRARDARCQHCAEVGRDPRRSGCRPRPGPAVTRPRYPQQPRPMRKPEPGS